MKGLSMFQIILLCVFGALAIAGVLIFSLAVSSRTGSTTGPVAIWGTLDRNAFQSVLQQLADTNQDFLQVTYEQKDADTFIAELTEALASGTGPDLAILREDSAYAQAGRMIPISYQTLSPEQFTGIFSEAAMPFLGQNGVIALPLLVDPIVLYWNRDMLPSAGYGKPPEFWDEVYGMAKVITKRTDTGTITKSAISFGQYKNYDNAKAVLSMLILQAGGGITKKDAEGGLISALSPAGATASQSTPAALRFYTEFADPSKDHYSWSGALPNAREEFAAGDLAIYFGLASERGLIRDTNPNLNFSIASTTQIRGSQVLLSGGHAYGLAIPRTSKNPQGAQTIAYLLASRDISSLVSLAVGLPSARRDVLSATPENGDMRLFNRQALITRTWIDPDPAQTAQIFRGMIEDTTSGALLLNEAVQRADRQLANLIAQ